MVMANLQRSASRDERFEAVNVTVNYGETGTPKVRSARIKAKPGCQLGRIP
jgi:hypothetical protein